MAVRWAMAPVRRQPAAAAQPSACSRSSSARVTGAAAPAAGRRRSPGSSSARVGAEHRRAARLEPDHRHARRRTGRRASSVRRSTRRAVPSWPVEIQVSPQHSGSRRHRRPRNPASSSTSTAACPTAGCEVVGEGVRPQQHRRRASPAPAGGRGAPPVLKRLRRRSAGARAAGRSRRRAWSARRAARARAVERVDHAGRGRRARQPRPAAAASPSRSARAGASRPGSGGPGTRPCRWPCRRRPGSRVLQPLQARHRSSASRDLRRAPAVA